jgi:hypothetical protein
MNYLQAIASPLSYTLGWAGNRLALTAFVCILAQQAIAVHPFHISTGELEYNTRSRRFEVGLRVQAVDLEQAVQRVAGKPLNIDKSESDKAIAKYLAENFYIAPQSVEAKKVPATEEEGELLTEGASVEAAPVVGGLKSRAAVQELPQPTTKSVKLVGKEFETSWVWLYFEIEVPAVPGTLLLVNRVMMDINTAQINTCTVRYVGGRKALKMTTSAPAVDFDRLWMKPSTAQ